MPYLVWGCPLQHALIRIRRLTIHLFAVAGDSLARLQFGLIPIVEKLFLEKLLESSQHFDFLDFLVGGLIEGMAVHGHCVKIGRSGVGMGRNWDIGHIFGRIFQMLMAALFLSFGLLVTALFLNFRMCLAVN